MAFDYADKITGLLAKAEDEATTAAEAEMLRQKAYDLMVKHSIDQAMIDAKRARGESTDEEIITDTIVFTGIYAKALAFFAHNVVMAFGTMNGYIDRSWAASGGGGKRHAYTIVGYESDVRQVRALIVSLQLQAHADLAGWWSHDAYAEVIRTTGTAMQKFKARREFITSFAATASIKIKERVQRAMSDAGPGTEVAVRSRLDAVKAWLAAQELGLRPTRGIERGDHAAAVAGAEAGRNADTGEARIGPRRVAIEG